MKAEEFLKINGVMKSLRETTNPIVIEMVVACMEAYAALKQGETIDDIRSLLPILRNKETPT